MADVDPRLGQEILDVAQRQRVSHGTITTRRITSSELLKYRNGLLMARSYHSRTRKNWSDNACKDIATVWRGKRVVIKGA